MAEFFDVEGIPVSLGFDPAGTSSAAWDKVPPRVVDPGSIRRNGVPMSMADFLDMLSIEALAFALSKPPSDGRITSERLEIAIVKFKKENEGKTWEDLAREIEEKQGLGKPSV